MAMAIVDLPRHKLADVIDRLAQTIRDLESENAALKKQIEIMDRKALHGCYDTNCDHCDKEHQ